MKQDESTLGIVITTTAIKTTTSTRLIGIRFCNSVVVYAYELSCVCNDSFNLSVYIAIPEQLVISDDNIHKYINLTFDLFASPYSFSTY